MRDLLKSLAGCKDVANLRSVILELSAEFGEIAHMDILTVRQPGKRQALCFLQLESAMQERQLMASPGVTRFGSELLCVVDLPEARLAGQAERRVSARDIGRPDRRRVR